MAKLLYWSGVLVVGAWLVVGGSLRAQEGAGWEASAPTKAVGAVEVVVTPKPANATPGAAQPGLGGGPPAGLPSGPQAELPSALRAGGSSAPADSSSAQAGDPSAQTGKQRALALQTEKLAAMATELKASVDKTNKDILSWAVVQQAQQIEQYAHQLRLGEEKR